MYIDYYSNNQIYSFNILCIKVIHQGFVLFKLDTSRMNQFKCTNEKYIPASHACDGMDDCGDHSDETKGCSGTFQNQAKE